MSALRTAEADPDESNPHLSRTSRTADLINDVCNVIASAATSRARSSARSARAGLARLDHRTGDLGDQIGLPVGRRPERTQVPRLDAVVGQRARALRDHHRMLVEESAGPGRDHAGLDQGGEQLVVDPRARQQVLAAQPDLGGRHRRADLDVSRLAGHRHQTRYAVGGSGARQLTVGLGVQLGLDDLQRQVLVALRGQDEPQPRTVVGGEPPITRRRPLRA